MNARLFVHLLGLLLAASAAAGCRQEQITQYQAPKDGEPGEQGAAATGPKKLIVGGILFRGKNVWFFKLIGPEEQVREAAPAFQQMFRSVELNGDEADWTLAEGWQRLPGNESRYASLKSSSQPDLDGSVTRLPQTDDDRITYLTHNIDRWCDQIGRPAPRELGDVAQLLSTDKGYNGIWVDLGGVPPPVAAEVPNLGYDTPEGWKPGKTSELRKAAFLVEDGEKQVEITVVALPADSNPLLANVNRWREQVALPAIDETQLKQDVQEVAVGEQQGSYVQLVGPEQNGKPSVTVLGAVLYRGDYAWFFKLKGDSALAAREKERFLAFLRSVKFTEK